MIGLLSVVLALLVFSQPAHALGKKIKALMSELDCVAYKLTDTRQHGKLVDESRVWIIINEGPTSVIISASKGARMKVKAFSEAEGPILLSGDLRLDYSVSLAGKGSALLHACTTR